MKKAVCTWGEGPDVLVSLENDVFILFEEPDKSHFAHGVVTQGQMDLSAAEAERLAAELLIAAREARRLESICQQHDDAVKEAAELEFAEYEIKALKKSPTALEVLENYHAVNEAEAEAMDMSGPMKFHEKRRKEIEAEIKRLKKQQE